MARVKICGLRRKEDVELVNKLLPDYIGFVFARSKRQIQLSTAVELKKLLDPKIKAVGVFVNAPLEEILVYEKAGVIDLIQLHGDESIMQIRALRKLSNLPIIKAIRIKDERSLMINRAFIEEKAIDYLLVDTYSENQYGGVGKCFDWQLLEAISRPFFLAGGIDAHNVKGALNHKPFAVDVSSGVETMGYKDAKKVEVLISKVRDVSR